MDGPLTLTHQTVANTKQRKKINILIMVINYNEEIMYVIINTFFSGNLLKITKYYITLTFYLV